VESVRPVVPLASVSLDDESITNDEIEAPHPVDHHLALDAHAEHR